MEKTDRTKNPICGPRPGLCEPSTAGARDRSLPHHPHCPPGRHHHRPHPTVRLEGLCHQRGAHAAVFAGGGVVLPQRIPCRTPLQSPLSRVHIAPLFVKRNEQIEGLTYLLTLGVRVLTVLEFVLRRSLESEHAKLPGLHPENKQKMADKPTAERILQAFRNISLTIIKNGAGEEILRRLTPLSGGQEAILQRLGLGANLYQQLEIQNIEK